MISGQGLADTFILLGMPFDSAEAKQLNKEIFETIYFAALEKSCSLAKMDGGLIKILASSQENMHARPFCCLSAVLSNCKQALMTGNHAFKVLYTSLYLKALLQ